MRNDTILITRPGLDHLCSRVQKSSALQDSTWSLAWRRFSSVGAYTCTLLPAISERVCNDTDIYKERFALLPLLDTGRPVYATLTGWLRKCISFYPVLRRRTSADGCKNGRQGRLTKVMEESLADMLAWFPDPRRFTATWHRLHCVFSFACRSFLIGGVCGGCV